MRDTTSQANFGIVLRSMVAHHNDEANELRYVMHIFYLLVVIRDIATAIRVEVNITQCLTKRK